MYLTIDYCFIFIGVSTCSSNLNKVTLSNGSIVRIIIDAGFIVDFIDFIDIHCALIISISYDFDCNFVSSSITWEWT